jgi:hypothetical protein
MNIEIKLPVPITDLTQAKLHQIRRVATVLRSDGFTVTVTAPVDTMALPEEEIKLSF